MMEKKITDFTGIKSFEDAQQTTGRPDVPAFSDVPEDMREYFQNQYRAIVITEAINGGWKADWSDDDQRKWIPWFVVNPSAPSGFAFDGAGYYCSSSAYAGDASRLCFETEAKAAHAGRTFTEIFAAIITK